MTTTRYVLKTPAEILQTKLEIWQSRLAYASQHDRKYAPECERAIADLKAKIGSNDG